MYSSPQPSHMPQPSLQLPDGWQAVGLNATGPQGAQGPQGTVPAQPVKPTSAAQYNAIESRLTNDMIRDLT